jgi:SAM-dependent methyltransferase
VTRTALAIVFFGGFLFAGPALPALPVRPDAFVSPDPSGLPALPDLAGPSQSTNAKLFAPQELGLLEGPDREEWQKPDLIMDALRIAEGSIVADLGAGGGWFSVRLARRVGPRGRVYAEDIQPQMIDAIRGRVERETLRNVTTVLGTAENPRLPTGSIDAALIVGSFHEMQFDESGKRRDPIALLQNVMRSLKPQGRLGVVDFLPGGGGPGPDADQRVDPDSVVKAVTGVGLQFVSRDEVPPFEYMLIFVKGKAGS